MNITERALMMEAVVALACFAFVAIGYLIGTA